MDEMRLYPTRSISVRVVPRGHQRNMSHDQLTLSNMSLTPWLVRSGAVLAASHALHARMVRRFASLQGIGFGIVAGLFHQVHLIYSSATMVFCALEHISHWRRH